MGKFLKNRDIFKGDVTKKINEYKPVANYEQFEINDGERKELIECEKNILFHQQKTKEHLMAISETLFKAQEVLAKYGSGSFKIWFEELGLKKDFVYMCIRRQKLYLEYETEKVMELPERVIKEITRENGEVEYGEDDIYKIIEAEKPTEVLKEIKNHLSGCPTNGNKVQTSSIYGTKDEIIEILPSQDEILAGKKQRLRQVNIEIRELEKELRSLKKKRESLENEIAHMDNEKLFYER